MTDVEDAIETFYELSAMNRERGKEINDWNEPESQSRVHRATANAYEDAAHYLERNVNPLLMVVEK